MPPLPTIGPDLRFKISMGLAMTTILAAVGFGIKFQQTLSGIEQKFDKLSTRLDAFELVMGDRWTKTAAAEWALRLQIKNPTISIPDPRSPNQLLKDN